VDRDIVKRYRVWLRNHFKNEFTFEQNSIMSLAKVRDAISSVMVLAKSSDYDQMKLKEFDLLVRVDEIRQIDEF
jgi:hypothetical protein